MKTVQTIQQRRICKVTHIYFVMCPQMQIHTTKSLFYLETTFGWHDILKSLEFRISHITGILFPDVLNLLNYDVYEMADINRFEVGSPFVMLCFYTTTYRMYLNIQHSTCDGLKD